MRKVNAIPCGSEPRERGITFNINGGWHSVFASKPAPTLDLTCLKYGGYEPASATAVDSPQTPNPCGSGLAHDEARPSTTKPATGTHLTRSVGVRKVLEQGRADAGNVLVQKLHRQVHVPGAAGREDFAVFVIGPFLTGRQAHLHA